MKIRKASTLCFIAILMVAGAASAAQWPAGTPSLGALARKLRAERACEKPVVVYTNDNVPHASSAPESSAAFASQVKKPEAAKLGFKAQPKRDQHYFESQSKKLKDRLAADQRDLKTLQEKLAAGSTNYHSNPQKTLEQESTPAFYSDRNKLLKQIEAKKQQSMQDQKAMNDLTDELRRAGGDPGWLR